MRAYVRAYACVCACVRAVPCRVVSCVVCWSCCVAHARACVYVSVCCARVCMCVCVARARVCMCACGCVCVWSLCLNTNNTVGYTTEKVIYERVKKWRAPIQPHILSVLYSIYEILFSSSLPGSTGLVHERLWGVEIVGRDCRSSGIKLLHRTELGSGNFPRRPVNHFSTFYNTVLLLIGR